jgi:hypothetical protein
LSPNGVVGGSSIFAMRRRPGNVALAPSAAAMAVVRLANAPTWIAQ